MIFTILCFVLGLTMIIASSQIWKKRYGNQYIPLSALDLRRKFRNISALGMLISLQAFIAFWMLLKQETSSLIYQVILPSIFMADSRLIFEPYYKPEVFNHLENFCLYLRPFNKEYNKQYFVKGLLNSKHPIEKIIGKELSQTVAKFYCVGDPNASLPTNLNASCIYASDEEWKDVVTHMTQNAKLVVLRLKNTEGCLWEMRHCISNHLDKTIFLVDNDEELLLLKEYLAESNVDIPNITINDGCAAVFYHLVRERWFYICLKSKRDIKQMLQEFSSSHTKLKDEIEHIHSYNHILTAPFSKKDISNKLMHYLLFFTQPIWYVVYNNWPKVWMCILGANTALLFVLLFVCLFLEQITLYVFLCIVCYAFWVWLAPRITFSFNSWGSYYLTNEGNKVLFKWYLVYAILGCIFSFI